MTINGSRCAAQPEKPREPMGEEEFHQMCAAIFHSGAPDKVKKLALAMAGASVANAPSSIHSLSVEAGLSEADTTANFRAAASLLLDSIHGAGRS